MSAYVFVYVDFMCVREKERECSGVTDGGCGVKNCATKSQFTGPKFSLRNLLVGKFIQIARV